MNAAMSWLTRATIRERTGSSTDQCRFGRHVDGDGKVRGKLPRPACRLDSKVTRTRDGM